jgi:hypothetical protein
LFGKILVAEVIKLYSECFTAFMAQPLGSTSFINIPLMLLLTVHVGYFEVGWRNYKPLHAVYLALTGYANYWALFTGLAMFDDCLSPVVKPVIGIILIALSLYGMTGLMRTIIKNTLQCTAEKAAAFQMHWATYVAVITVSLVLYADFFRFEYY